MLDPLQEGGPVTAAAAAVLEQLVIKSRHLLKDKMKSLPPLPQGVDRLGIVAKAFLLCCLQAAIALLACCWSCNKPIDLV